MISGANVFYRPDGALEVLRLCAI